MQHFTPRFEVPDRGTASAGGSKNMADLEIPTYVGNLVHGCHGSTGGRRSGARLEVPHEDLTVGAPRNEHMGRRRVKSDAFGGTGVGRSWDLSLRSQGLRSQGLRSQDLMKFLLPHHRFRVPYNNIPIFKRCRHKPPRVIAKWLGPRHAVEPGIDPDFKHRVGTVGGQKYIPYFKR